jgi:CopG family transcriptional regulator / antitoxin EndoAI
MFLEIIQNQKAMARRINVILSEDTVRTIDRMVRPRERSRFIQTAVQHYVATASPEALQERLKQAALRDHDLDLEIANDWSAVDQEQWQRLEREKRSPSTTRSAARSTSRRSTRP